MAQSRRQNTSGNYNNNNRSNNRNNNSNSPKSDEIVNHSECFFHESYTDKKTGEIVNKPFITAWNYSKTHGLVNMIASPWVKKLATKSKHFEKWIVKITNAQQRTTTTTLGLFDLRTQKLTLPELQMVANHKARKKKGHGYFGTYVKRSN